MKAPNKRQRAERKGRWAEHLVTGLLLLKGYRILAVRWRCKSGEVDIIARKKATIVMVEVKARDTEALALEAVHYKTRQRIENAARKWLQTHPQYQNCGIRFDIATISNWKFMHVKQAWLEGE